MTRMRSELEVDLLHVALPFHGRRNPRGALFSGEYFWTADLVRSVEAVRQAACDARAAFYYRRRGFVGCMRLLAGLSTRRAE